MNADYTISELQCVSVSVNVENVKYLKMSEFKTYVLLHWIKTKNVTIMEEPINIIEKSEGDTVTIPYGKKSYDAVLIKRSGK